MEEQVMSGFRNPPYKWRVISVAVAFSILGILAGELIAVLIPFPGGFWSASAVGLVLGAIAGGYFEARK